MPLDKYKEKRDFQQTPEPEGTERKSNERLEFVIQRHHASQLHYDLRLELEGVLKSWAVPKGPSLNPKQKRLAMMTEDHPYEYISFEGDIPEGNYGAGIMEIWDSGWYESAMPGGTGTDEEQLLQGLAKGDMKFRLHGKKMQGEFALVKMKKMGKNGWLLIKHRDDFATEEEYDSEDHIDPHSRIPRRK